MVVTVVDGLVVVVGLTVVAVGFAVVAVGFAVVAVGFAVVAGDLAVELHAPSTLTATMTRPLIFDLLFTMFSWFLVRLLTSIWSSLVLE